MELDLPPVMGHRGAAAWAPENTLASIRKAAELGATWVEFDVMLTGDGRPVLFHDDNLKRLTGLDALMARTPYSRVKGLDAGRWFSPQFAGEPVPTLEAALELVWDLGLDANIEIKPTPGRDVETTQAALEVAAAGLGRGRRPPMISSFSRMSLAGARVLQPDWPRALIAFKVPSDWQTALEALGCASFHLSSKVLNPPFVAEIKRTGYQVAAFTVNQKRRARELIACGVDCLISDAPDRVKSLLASPEGQNAPVSAVRQASR